MTPVMKPISETGEIPVLVLMDIFSSPLTNNIQLQVTANGKGIILSYNKVCSGE